MKILQVFFAIAICGIVEATITMRQFRLETVNRADYSETSTYKAISPTECNLRCQKMHANCSAATFDHPTKQCVCGIVDYYYDQSGNDHVSVEIHAICKSTGK